MSYWGSEAYDLDVAERGARTEGRTRHNFELVRGEGLGMRTHQALSQHFVAFVKLSVALVIAGFALGFCRVALSVATVSVLQDNKALSTSISEETSRNRELKVEHSILSSSTRIDRIATQNYGMVFPTSSDTITLGSDISAGNELNNQSISDETESSENTNKDSSTDLGLDNKVSSTTLDSTESSADNDSSSSDAQDSSLDLSADAAQGYGEPGANAVTL